MGFRELLFLKFNPKRFVLMLILVAVVDLFIDTTVQLIKGNTLISLVHNYGLTSISPWSCILWAFILSLEEEKD